MGIYDRAYIREDERTNWFSGRSVVVNLIIINVVIWLAGAIFGDELRDWLALKGDMLFKPWMCWQLITYGFAHADTMHLVFNMLILYFVGRDVEEVYGRAEFLRIYLVAVVLAGLAWVIMVTASPQAVPMVTVPEGADPRILLQVAPRVPELVGASGGIMAIMILFVLNFPRRLLYIWGIIPVPAWALGVFYVLGDLLGFANPAGSNVANIAHLAGMGFGFVYFQTKLNLGRFVPGNLTSLQKLWTRPKLRIHDPDEEARKLNQQVDAILEKISRQGEASLTKKERRTLEEASRRYQRRRE